MQIEIDFDVYKALTLLRSDEADSYNHVLRRLLELPDSRTAQTAAKVSHPLEKTIYSALQPHTPGARGLGIFREGAWFGNIHFPEGSKFRGTYKGQTFFAEIKQGKWVGQDGIVRNSPSDAAGAISGTNVNGWKFWHVLKPGEATWIRIEELKK